MSPTQLESIEKMRDAGESVTQGVLPPLDPIAAEYAEDWSTLRASTPGDQPISITSLALYVGEDQLHRKLPLMQAMDRAYFEFQADRRKEERRQAEQKAKARRGRGRRG